MKSWALLGMLLVAGVAGCLDRDSGDGAKDGPGHSAGRLTPPEDPMPEGAGHNHGDPSQHRFLWNYDFAARDPLMQDAANVAGVHALDVQAGWLFGAVYGSHAASVNGGLVIWDVHTDPAHPVEVGRWTIPGSVGGDRSLEATPDGDYAVLATESVDCAGHVNPAAAVAAYLIDTRDKELPVVADTLTFTGQTLGGLLGGETGLRLPGIPFGEHSVAVHRIAEEDYALIFGKLHRIERGEQGARLVHVADLDTGHDVYLRDTPWGTAWGLSANGAGGLVVWDVSDPEHPFQIATWDLPDRRQRESEGVEHYFHTADVSFQDGTPVIVLTSEDFAEHVSPLWVLDGSPLAGLTERPDTPHQLEMVGTWHNPGNHSALSGLTFSLHNPRFHDGGLLTLSSYHGGMWQLDVRGAGFWKDPAPVAYAVFADGEPPLAGDPAEQAIQEQVCKLSFNLDTPSYWDVEVGPDGIAYLADGVMGLYTFVPTDSHPVYGDAEPGQHLGTAGT